MNKIYQQNIFGGEDEVLTQIPVYVYRNKETGFYLTAKLDFVDFSNPCGDTLEFEKMLICYKDDYIEPTIAQSRWFMMEVRSDIFRKTETYESELRYVSVSDFDAAMTLQAMPTYKGVTI